MKKQITLLFALSVAIMLNANNINITNIKVTGQNTTAGADNPANYSLVQFDLSWDNSWRTSSAPNNWDAAWVFVKYRITSANGGDNLWKHAWLNNDGHSGTDATIDAGLLTPGSTFNATTNPALGVFIYRSDNVSGTFSITGAQLRWNYGANGVSDNATVDVQVFAIEMVYVPEGSFYVGSGSGGSKESGAFYKYPTATNPYRITSENAITVGTATDNLYYPKGANDYPGDQSGPIPAAFPKGYAGFYCQKYEITQQQYVDFLNTLTQTQANIRKFNKPTPNYRYEITGVAVGSYATANPYVACNFLSWMDGAAYSDWAGLRPMTELEYEKACRGTATPVAEEYAWGNATAIAAETITTPGARNETTDTPNANVVFDIKPNVQGPMRVGVFAKSNTMRAEAGASYYGIMELSGNLWERAVTVGNVAGRAYAGVHGNGTLNASGAADVDYWPGINGNSITTTANTTYAGTTGVTEAAGSDFKGGNWNFNYTLMRVSDRFYAAYPENTRDSSWGFRAVRRVP